MNKKLLLSLGLLLCLASCQGNGNQNSSSLDPSSSSLTTSQTTSSNDSSISSGTSQTTSSIVSSTTSSTVSSQTTSNSSSNVSSNNSSSTSSTVVALSSYNITFKGGTDGQEINSTSINLPSGVTVDDYYKVYNSENNSIRIGASKDTGYITFKLNPSVKVQSVKISGKTYGNDSDVRLNVSTSSTEKQVTLNGSFNQTISFNDSSASSQLSFETVANKKRVLLYSIEIVYGEGGGSSSGSEGGSQGGGTTDSRQSIKYISQTNPTNGNVPSSKQNYSGYYQPTLHETLNFDNFAYYSYEEYLQTTGKSKILVIPVDFTDYRASDKLGGEDASQLNIYNSFFGESEDTGWESVRTYYEKSSYGALTIEGEVTPWYNTTYSTNEFCKKQYSGYSEYSDYYTPTWGLLDEVTSWAKNTLKIDLSEYDNDKDGFIDGVWMVYSCPEQYVSSNIDTNEEYWAYTYGNYKNYDNHTSASEIVPYIYCWGSYNFIYEGNYGKPDAHTYIHETGHMLGLDDYYNYDSDNVEGVSGGVDMMDYNIGDHNAYSKYLLNWTSPFVVDGSLKTTTINLKPFESSGQFILLSDNFNDSPFDEYILIEYYTPTGLNAKDTAGYTQGVGTYTQSGVKISHVDSRILLDMYDEDDYWVGARWTESFEDNDLYYYSIGSSNTPSSSYNAESEDNSPYRLYHLIEATNNFTFTGNTYYANYGNNNVLFHTNDTFSLNSYSKFFVETSKLNNGNALPYTVSIGSTNTDGSITITVTKN